MKRLVPALLAASLLLPSAPRLHAEESSSPFDMAPERSNLPPSPVPITPPAAAPEPAQAAPVPPKPVKPPDNTYDRPILPFSHLVLEGEIDARAWEVVLTREQAASPVTLTLGYKASVVVAPETSRLTLVINNQAVFDAPVTASGEVGKLSAELPAGLLKAGANLFRLQIVQRHRTDCTVSSTYELRTEIDSASTALHFTSPAAARLSRIEDLAAVGPDFNGYAHLRILMPSIGRKSLAGPVLRFSQASAILIGMPSLSVSVTGHADKPADPGTLTAAIGTAEELRSVMKDLPQAASNRPIVTFVGDPALGPSTLVVSGPTPAAVAQAVEALAVLTDRPKKQAREVLDTSGWFAPNPPLMLHAAHITLANLGITTQEFAGRRFKTEFQIGIPSDFYSVSSGEATLLLDAAYSSEVLPSSHLDIYINGDIAATAPLSTSGGEILRHLPIRIPMSHFRPGPNRITFEAQLHTNSDLECATGPTKGANRFALFDSSEFVMPNYARIAQLPNLAALQGTAFPYNSSTEPVALVLSNTNEDTLSAAATLLSRMAVAAGRPINLDLDPPSLENRDTLFIAPAPEIPDPVPAQLDLDEHFRTSWQAREEESQPGPVVAGNAIGNSATNAIGSSATAPSLPVVATEPVDTQETFDRWRDTLSSEGGGWRGNVSAFEDWLQRTFQVSSQTLRLLPTRDMPYHPSRDATVMIAQGPSPSGDKAWTLITSPTAELLRKGAVTLTGSPQWFQLTGRLVTYNARVAEVQTQPVTTFAFVPTQPISFANLRLIAANWLSENLLAFALLLFAACLVLGLATALFLSCIGRRSSQ